MRKQNRVSYIGNKPERLPLIDGSPLESPAKNGKLRAVMLLHLQLTVHHLHLTVREFPAKAVMNFWGNPD